MNTKLKKLKDLERKLIIKIDEGDYNEEFTKKLNNIKSRVKIDGFRKGKVPDDVVKQQYGQSIHAEVFNDLIQKTYPKAIKTNNLRPAASPSIEITSNDPKQLSYEAIFEVFPDIKPKISRWTSYEEFSINIENEDVENAIKDISKRFGEWSEVKRKSKIEDQVTIDFKGSINGEEFEGNSASDFKLILGSKSMIPGFEDSILDKGISNFKIKCKFPEDYFKKDLANSDVEFDINLKKIEKLTPAKFNLDLYKKLDMKVKNLEEFKTEILNRMKKEVSIQQDDLTKESIYETLLKMNKVQVPQVTVKEQSELMRKDALMRSGQKPEEASDDLFPIDSFSDNAEKRVKLDLLFAEYVKYFDIKIEKSDIDNHIESESKKYKDPSQFKQWINNQPQQLEQFKMIVIEKKLIEKLKNVLKSSNKMIKFSELANR